MNLEARLDDVRQEYIRRMTQGDSALLRQVEQYTASHTGKMLRPRMLLASAATQGETCLYSQRTLLLAVIVEMLHNTSLLHDDVIDNGTVRRGQPTVNAHWNNAIAVLVGDYHLVKIMELLHEIGDNDITRAINRTVETMVQAELLQQEPAEDSHGQNAPARYLKIIDGKTANLFAAAAALGNPLYRDFGLHYGRLFQICDDIRDNEAPPFAHDLLRTLQQPWPEAFASLPDPRTIVQ